MNNQEESNPRWLLEQLEDPFTMFPVESVADSLFKIAEEEETAMYRRMGPWGVGRKYWSVEEEHRHETIGLIVGTAFVLDQAAITQSVSIMNQLRKHKEAVNVIPKQRTEKLSRQSLIYSESGLSHVLIVEVCSNYFKHHYEWPEHWSCDSSNGAQQKTIALATKLGMEPGEVTDNVLLAANKLNLNERNPRAIASAIIACFI